MYLRKSWVRSAAALAIALSVAVTGVDVLPSPAQAASRPLANSAAGTLLPAAKKLGAPRIVAVAGNRSLTVSWGKVKGAKKYRVEVSPSKTFSRATKRSTTKALTKAVGGLKNKGRYYVRVSAIAGSKRTTSRTASVKPSNAKPRAISRAKVTKAGRDRIKVTWRRTSPAQRYWVVASYTSGRLKPTTRTSGYALRSRALPGTAASVTLTLPAALRARLGTNTGNPIAVQVYARNAGKVARSGMAVGWASPPAVRGSNATKVSLATYNVLGLSHTVGWKGRDWAARRAKVVRSILRSNADVVAVQEASMSKTETGIRQFEDLANLLRPHGYALAYDPQVAFDAREGVNTIGSHLFYKTSRMQVLDSGVTLIRDTVASSGWASGIGASAGGRNIAWAKLKSKASGATFVAVSLHLIKAHDKVSIPLRNTAIGGIERFARAKAGGRPAVLMGDFNSYLWRYPNGPDTVLVSRGWVNAAASAAYSGRKYPTYNDRSNGFPSKPATSYMKVAANRIDQIIVKGGSGTFSYTNQVSLNRAGKYDPAYQGSDHNLQRAIVSIR